jgi:hypothetical protein
MTAIYTKDGLTVHFSSEFPCEVELLTSSLLTTVILAIEHSQLELSISERIAICSTIRFVHDVLPMEKDYQSMYGANTKNLKDALNFISSEKPKMSL